MTREMIILFFDKGLPGLIGQIKNLKNISREAEKVWNSFCKIIL